MATLQVVAPRPGNAGRFAHTVYQEDVEKLEQLSALLSLFRDLYLAQRDFITTALDSGAKMEPGAHDAWLIEQEHGGYMIPAGNHRRLRWR